MWAVTRNPPLACYYLAISAMILGWSEPALHIAFLLPAAAHRHIFIILAWGAGEIFERCRLPRAAVWVAAILILSVCAGRTMGQLRFWQNTETLFGHAIAVTKGNDVAHYNLGEYYFGKNRLDEAIDNYRKAIQIRRS